MTNDEFIDDLMRRTEFVVEADSFARLKLWEEWNECCDWEHISLGCAPQLGELAGMPVVASLCWAIINGRVVLFWEGVSLVFDGRLWEKYKDENGLRPWWDGGRRAAQCDAMNFHLCMDHCGGLPRKKKEKA